MEQEYGMARQLWRLLEPLHAMLYYAPEVFEESAALGYRTDERWPSYFALRAAPLGPASRELVTATFYSFNPDMVGEHVPAAWSVAAPERVLEARLHGIDRFYRRLLDDRIAEPGLAEAAALTRRAAQAAVTAGRPLAAANAALPWPDEAHLVLWQAITVLREHRGDGHVVALQAAGLDPVEALASFSAAGAAPAEVFASRGWPAEQWGAAVERLRSRGLIGADGAATEAGLAARDRLERHTDELAGQPWRELGDSADTLAGLVFPVLKDLLGTGLLPSASTLGMGTRFGYQSI